MTEYKQVVLNIEKGRKLHKAISVVILESIVTREQLEAVLKIHKFKKVVLDLYLITGIIELFEVTGEKPLARANNLEYGKKYLGYWKIEPDDEMAYYASIIHEFENKISDYYQFVKSYEKQGGYSHCKQCDQIFPAQPDKRYCSEKCLEIDIDQQNNASLASILRTAIDGFLKLLSTLNLNLMETIAISQLGNYLNMSNMFVTIVKQLINGSAPEARLNINQTRKQLLNAINHFSYADLGELMKRVQVHSTKYDVLTRSDLKKALNNVCLYRMLSAAVILKDDGTQDAMFHLLVSGKRKYKGLELLNRLGILIEPINTK